jgi:uncharacterized protein (TIGR03118 family)
MNKLVRDSHSENAGRRSAPKRRVLRAGILALFPFAVGALSLHAQQNVSQFVQTNLVSNIPGLAMLTDPDLVNPWGVSHSATSPFWVSDHGTNVATLYAVTGQTNVSKVPLTVAIPVTGVGPQGPTGQVNNGNISSFAVKHGGDGGPAHFIFSNFNGTISAWDKGATAIVQATTPGAVYTGLAINGAQTRLYAPNWTTGRLDVFDSSFAPVSLPAGAFLDPSLPAGLTPFNAQDINGDVYVMYAPPGFAAASQAPLGAGAVAIFDEDGNFIKQLVAGGRLAAPWGIAIAPPSFGRFSNHVLVGSFSFLHSEINAFDPTNGDLHGTIPIDIAGQPAGGLWFIGFGVGGNNGSPDALYFSYGLNGGNDGLFGAITRHRS